jgi:hypothetical protein
MNLDVTQLETRATVIRTYVAALRAFMGTEPPPEGSALKVLLDLLYNTADEVVKGVEVLADVTAEVDRAAKPEKSP